MYPKLIPLTYGLVDDEDGKNTMRGTSGTVQYLVIATQNVCKRRKNQQHEEPEVLNTINKIVLVKLTTTWYSCGVSAVRVTSVL